MFESGSDVVYHPNGLILWNEAATLNPKKRILCIGKKSYGEVDGEKVKVCPICVINFEQLSKYMGTTEYSGVKIDLTSILTKEFYNIFQLLYKSKYFPKCLQELYFYPAYMLGVTRCCAILDIFDRLPGIFENTLLVRFGKFPKIRVRPNASYWDPKLSFLYRTNMGLRALLCFYHKHRNSCAKLEIDYDKNSGEKINTIPADIEGRNGQTYSFDDLLVSVEKERVLRMIERINKAYITCLDVVICGYLSLPEEIFQCEVMVYLMPNLELFPITPDKQNEKEQEWTYIQVIQSMCEMALKRIDKIFEIRHLLSQKCKFDAREFVLPLTDVINNENPRITHYHNRISSNTRENSAPSPSSNDTLESVPVQQTYVRDDNGNGIKRRKVVVFGRYNLFPYGGEELQNQGQGQDCYSSEEDRLFDQWKNYKR